MEHVQPDGTYSPDEEVARCSDMHRATLKQTISRNFRLSRLGINRTQETFGELIGWSRTRVNKAESGRFLASPEHVEIWAEATGRDPFWFYTPHEDAEELEAVA
jgi:transcriptional regulator with XRE-family HTH domain